MVKRGPSNNIRLHNQLEVTNPSHFKRNTKQKDIGLISQTKKYGVVFEKRVIVSKSSFPFGFARS